jgi:hypothetical protein
MFTVESWDVTLYTYNFKQNYLGFTSYITRICFNFAKIVTVTKIKKRSYKSLLHLPLWDYLYWSAWGSPKYSLKHLAHIVYYDQQMHNYFTNYHTATRFSSIVSSSESCNQYLAKLHKVFQTQLLVIQFTIKMFHTSDSLTHTQTQYILCQHNSSIYILTVYMAITQTDFMRIVATKWF